MKKIYLSILMKNVRKNMSAMALLTLAMSALMPQKAQAQDRIPFLAEGKTWTVFNYDARYEGALVVKDSARYSVLGDTIVGGRTCKLVETEIGTVPAYQEGRNICFYYPDDAEPRIMYEFDCQVGDLVHVDSEREARAEVTKVDSVCVEGAYYRVVHYSLDGMEGRYDELIGSGTGVLNSTLVPGQFRGVEVSFHGKQLAAVRSIERGEKASADNRVYTLQGVRLQQPPKQGVYIQNGKKFVAK